MGSINLSQSIQEKQSLARGKFFDRGFFINLTVFLLIVMVYFGSIWYLGKLEKELAALQINSADKTVTLSGQSVNYAVDIRERIDIISNNHAVNPDLRQTFLNVERLTLSTIQLKSYAQKEAEQSVLIEGTTESLRYLAQQMLAYKRLEGVQSVHAEEIKYNEENGKIDFTLILQRINEVPGMDTPGSNL